MKPIAQFISWLFHPLLMLTYMICLLMVVNPYSFGFSRIGEGRSGLLIISIFLQAALIPGIAISMMKTLGLAPNLDLGDRTARIGPFIATGLLYLWLYANFNRLTDVPPVFKSAILGCVIALFTAFVLNIFSKISLHAIGMGSLIGMTMVTMLLFNYNSFQFGETTYSMYALLFLIIVLAGLVGSARMILENPSPRDLYGGYLVGFSTQLIALQFIA
ncbi:MAG: hypothetical protein AB8G86_12600 [Saprospiraceae bacterium]